MSRFDVVGFGALNVDRLFRVNRIAGAEEESFITSAEEACGGSAANTIVGLARLGCKTGFIGKASSDREGEMLLQDFLKEGVDTSGIQKADKGRTGVVTGYVDEKGQRALYIDPGVNDTVEYGEHVLKYASQGKLLHITSFVGQKSFQTQKKLVEKLPENVKVSFDPGALYARKGLASIEPLIRAAFAFMPNETELRLLTGRAEPEQGADSILEKGAKIVAVKLGGKGCYVTDGKERHFANAFRVKVTDTTGAGDAFNAGFLYGLLKKKSFAECAVIGNFAASRSITKMGARTGLPTLRDLELLR